jgi:hypothetical protein
MVAPFSVEPGSKPAYGFATVVPVSAEPYVVYCSAVTWFMFREVGRLRVRLAL